ncbi:STAS domain-containing protein [Bacillus sp. H-16]|uniref:STAS domain-containing protein n=1 Tax=Alteribacter salitolerans TaxID=2912333 RepID=UPI0019623AC1|nr:STAS domain-containing protein [Alteribacter salitolerans]MBM7094348.1 STAS domain-containing protein [Alteribacter salitolerans]
MLNQIPLPFIRIKSNYEVVDTSERARNEFPSVKSFLDLIDRDSREKAKKLISPAHRTFNLELNLLTKEHPLALFDVYGKWTADEEANIIVVSKDTRLQKVEGQLMTLQKRLRNTNFELYEKNEELEESIARTNRLSGPFITLSDEVALVPIFGDLFEEKLQAVRKNIYDAVYGGEFDNVLIDFTGVGIVKKEGLQGIREIFLALEYMGVQVIIIGIQPQHAQQMKSFKEELNMTYIQSAKEAIRRFLIES